MSVLFLSGEQQSWEVNDDGSAMGGGGGGGSAGKVRFEALHSYQAQESGELSFTKGTTLVEVGESPYEG